MILVRLFMCALVCSVVNCSSNGNKRQSVTFEEIDNEEEQCMDHSTAFRLNAIVSKCIPRDTVVRVSHKKPHFKLYPDVAIVKRCYNIGCHGNSTCLPVPTHIINRKVAVKIIDKFGMKNPKCSWVNVIEHTKCKCGCRISKDECEGMNRMFHPLDCTCKCKDEQNARKECSKQENMVWDEDNCICTCPAGGMQCSTGATWVPEFCRCMQINMNQGSVG